MKDLSSPSFILGVNYWPRCKAMDWWKDFSEQEVESEFKQIKSLHLDLVRIFLLWEDFQPSPHEINFHSIKNLLSVLDIADTLNLHILITLFTGHMSGVNWVPLWALSKKKREPGSFRTVSKNCVRNYKIGYFYRNPSLLKAQCLLIRQLVPAVKKHSSLYGWDLGNEPSILLQPNKVRDIVFWVKTLTSEIKKLDPDHPVTLGIHQGDLSHDSKFHPHALKPYLDIFSMHGYPNYSPWARNPMDPKSCPFLNILTERMINKPTHYRDLQRRVRKNIKFTGKKVFFTEFGLPVPLHIPRESSMFYATQDQAGRYFKNTLNQLYQAGSLGALVWCYSDYHPDLKHRAPFDQAPHELYFGITNWKGQTKKTARVLSQWGEKKRKVQHSPILKNFSTRKYFKAPEKNLWKLYQIFLDQV